MCDHFHFTSLPTEIQMRVIFFTDLVKPTVPARDLLPAQYSSQHGELGHFLCCGTCTPANEGCESCSCPPNSNARYSQCDCMIFAHLLLQVSRHTRELASDCLYQHARFELGPMEAWPETVDYLKLVDAERLARLRRFDVLIRTDSPTEPFFEESNWLLGS